MAVKIYGPYRHGEGYRCYLRAKETGARAECATCPTPQAALAAAEAELDKYLKHADLSVGDLADRYLAYLQSLERTPQTVSAVRNKLLLLLRSVWHSPVASISERQAKELYAALANSTLKKQPLPSQAEAARRAARSLICLERNAIKRLQEKQTRFSDTVILDRWTELDAFESRAMSGALLQQKGDSAYLVGLVHRYDRLAAKTLKKMQTERPAKKVAAASHQTALWKARELWRWGTEEALIKKNPWLVVRPLGRWNRGKPQLTFDETKRLVDLCLEHAATDDGALAVLMALLLGLRASEVAQRIVRDVDGDASYLNIIKAKTPAGTRRPEIPDCIQPALRLRLQDRKPSDVLLPELERRPSSGRQWVSEQVKRWCDAAGVPVICPHALRGGATSLAYEAGALPHLIAAMVGHASSKTTERHYANPDAVQNAAQRARLRHLKIV